MNDQCLLTTKDYTLLETMHDDPLCATPLSYASSGGRWLQPS